MIENDPTIVEITEQQYLVASDGEVTIVELGEPVLQLIAIAEQGPAGIQGPIGPAGSTELSKVAAQAISGHKVVAVNLNGELVYASNNNLVFVGKILGVTVSAGAAGTSMSVIRFGEISEPGWNWDTNKPVYLGVDGTLTQVSPRDTNALFQLVMGFPISSTTLLINPNQTIILTN